MLTKKTLDAWENVFSRVKELVETGEEMVVDLVVLPAAEADENTAQNYKTPKRKRVTGGNLFGDIEEILNKNKSTKC